MQYSPHDYQKYAIDFLETHPQAAVLLGCGLGKTSITLTALNDLMFDRFEVRIMLSGLNSFCFSAQAGRRVCRAVLPMSPADRRSCD